MKIVFLMPQSFPYGIAYMTDFRAYYMLQGSIEFQLFLKVVRNMPLL